VTTRKSDRLPRASARVWFYRVFTAVGIPAVLFLGLEGGLRVAGFGQSPKFLIPDEKPGFFRTNPGFAGLFLPGNFDLRPLNFRVAARKPPNTVRIVVLGESAAQGVPAPAFALAAQLRAQLRARYPGKDIEVINTGIVAINSHVVYRIARDLAAFSPDLFVVYMGNNEVVGPFGPGCAYLSKTPPLWFIRLNVFVRSTRTGQLISALGERLARNNRRPVEWGGMAMFVDYAVSGDDPRLEAVYRNFEANLTDIVRVATDAGAQTLLCTVVSNLKDCAPLLSLHRPGLSAAELAAWQQAFDRGKLAWKLGESAAARVDLQEALRLDPHYADTAFMLGTLELQVGDSASARKLLLEAEHWDALRFRPDPRINAIIREVAQRNPAGVGLLDAAMQLGSDPASSVTPAGRELLFEHVHFEWDGNYQLARLLAQGAEGALFGDHAGRPPWLDSPGCAVALAYTAHGRLTMLQKIAEIVRNPPFTNQLTYGEDQAKLAREISRAETAVRDPATMRRAQEAARAAMASDPENPALAAIAEEIDSELGDTAGALVQARRAAQFLPADPALLAGEASLLAQLGRYDEAEKILRRAASVAVEPDKMAPSFAALYSRMKRFEEGRGYLDRAIARHPADTKLRLMRGNLARLAGDTAGVEREFRAILADDPGNQQALEALVSQLIDLGQLATVERESLAVAEQQTKNQLNNLRVAMIYETRGDEEQAVRFLSAAERSGPATAAVELRIARKLYRLQRWDEMMTHLAEAKRLSVVEEDPESTGSIGQLIERMRAERH
jgi:tetratricopeptide (TPR) repeat protein